MADLLAPFRRTLRQTPLYRLGLGGPTPTGPAMIPSDCWPGDPAAGRRMLEGVLPLGNREIELAILDWSQLQGDPRVARALHGFSWMRDLRDLGGDAARRLARALVGDWIKHHHGWSALAFRPDIAATRTVSWLALYDFFCASADEEFRKTVLEHLCRTLRHVARSQGEVQDPLARLAVLKSLVYGHYVLGQSPRRMDWLLRKLVETTGQAVFGDGLVRSRSPAEQLDLVRHLIDLRAVMRQAGDEPPDAVEGTLGRAAPLLRLFRHGDRDFAAFNGTGEGPGWLIDTALAQSATRGRTPVMTPEGGFHRLAARRVVIIMDCGAPPDLAPDSAAAAHAGTLSFEMSIGKERLIVNCGAGPGNEAWRQAQRATAAHSTLTVDDVNSSEILPNGKIGRKPRLVRSKRREEDGGIIVEGRHDGYKERFGLTHTRRLHLAENGNELFGEDVLAGEGGKTYQIRFHLHPRVRAVMTRQADKVLLQLPSGIGWSLAADSAVVQIEDSLYMGASTGPQPSQQVVLSGAIGSRGTAVKWVLRREDRRS